MENYFNEKLEVEIIVSLIENIETRKNFFTGLACNDFYTPDHSDNFNLLREQFVKYGEVDISKLKNPPAYATGDRVEPFYCSEQIKSLRELSKKRSLVNFSKSLNEKVGELGSSELIEKAVNALSKIQYSSEPRKAGIADVMIQVNKYWDETRDKELVGIDTNTFLNEYIRGYRPSHYWIIGAYTNYGKTSFAAYLAAQLIDQKVPMAFFSVEMSANEIAIKILTQYLNFGEYMIRDCPNQFKEEIEEFSKAPLDIYDDKFSIDEIRLELFSLKAINKLPKVVFVDFIQNVTAKASNRYEMITQVTQRLQQTAKELKITIIALSQVSNEGMNSKTTTIPFKGSGEIASSADFALQLNRDMKNEAKGDEFAPLQIKIVKNRHGRHQWSQNFRLNLKNGVIDESHIEFQRKENKELSNFSDE